MAKDASLTKEAAKAKKANEKNSKKAALSKKPKKSIVKVSVFGALILCSLLC